MKLNLRLYGTSIIVNLTSFLSGCIITWSAQPFHDNVPYNRLIEEQNWLLFLLGFGIAIGIFISRYAPNAIGRKNVLLVSGLIAPCGIALLMFTTNSRSFYASKLVCGISIGIALTTVPLYLGEIAESDNRGALICSMGLFLTGGNLFTNFLEPILNFIEFSYILLIISMCFLVFHFFFIPESPYCLMQIHSYGDSYLSLKSLRRCNEEKLMEEFEEIRGFVQNSFHQISYLPDLFKKKEFCKGLSITVSLMAFQHLSGVHVITYFLRLIYEDTNYETSLDQCEITIGIIRVLSCLMTTIFVDRLGRRTLMLISCVGSGLALMSLGSYCYLIKAGEDIEKIYWMPVLSAVCFAIAFSLGLGPLPFVALGELFQHNTKPMVAATALFASLISGYCSIAFYPKLVNVIEMNYTFWIMAVFCFIAATFVYSFLPETKGRTFSEIQEILSK